MSSHSRRSEIRPVSKTEWSLRVTDHVQVAALGGEATVDEMRVLCRPHNMLHAEQVFGREYMARFRRGAATRERQPTML